MLRKTIISLPLKVRMSTLKTSKFFPSLFTFILNQNGAFSDCDLEPWLSSCPTTMTFGKANVSYRSKLSMPLIQKLVSQHTNMHTQSRSHYSDHKVVDNDNVNKTADGNSAKGHIATGQQNLGKSRRHWPVGTLVDIARENIDVIAFKSSASSRRNQQSRLIFMAPWARWVHNQNGISIGSAAFAQTHRQTNTQTTLRATPWQRAVSMHYIQAIRDAAQW